MTTSLEFKICNDLEKPDTSVKRLTVVNNYYHIHVRYIGDYTADRASGRLDFSSISMSAVARRPYFPQMQLTRDGILIGLEPGLYDLKRLPALIEGLDIAGQSAKRLMTILDDLFPDVFRPT